MLAVDKGLVSWASKIAGNDVRVSNDAQQSHDEPLSVTIYLSELTSAAPSHSNQFAPLQVTLKYLVFTSGKDVLETHELLDKLLFSAMKSSKFGNDFTFELELSPPSCGLWQSLGIPARPSFWLKVIHKKSRDIKPVPLVKEAITLSVFPNAVLSGAVVSTNGLPIVGARVDLPANNISVITDTAGRFKFGAVSPKLKNTKLVVTYKQYSYSSNVSISQSPIDIVFNFKEL